MAEELNNPTQGQDNSTPETDSENRTYTQAEVDELLQREVDRRITSALAKQQKKNEAKLKEAEKLASMSAQEKYEFELSQREAAIAEKERQLTLAENKNIASKILAEKGLSLTLVDFVIADDAETMNSNINILDRAFKASVKAEVEKRIGGKTPQTSTVAPGTLTREQFSKMSLAEKQNLFNTDRELYNSLIN